jgi:hypothetical protein
MNEAREAFGHRAKGVNRKEIQMGSVSHFGNYRKYSWKDLPRLFLDELRNAINRVQRPDRP